MSDAVDQIAEALREDPVVVSALFGNGRTDEVREALGEVVDDLDFPAYVVMVPRPEGLSANDPDRELASLLHDRIGGDGLYVVMTDPAGYGETIAAFGDVPDPYLRYQVEQQLYPDGGADAGLSPAGVVARDLEMLDAADAGADLTLEDLDAYAEQAVWREPPEWDLDYDVPTAGAYAVFMTMAFVAVAGCAWLLLRNAARWRETAPARQVEAAKVAALTSGAVTGGAVPGGVVRGGSSANEGPATEGPAAVRARAEKELDDLADRLAATAGNPQPDALRVLVDGSYDTARAVLERTGTEPEELDDLVGALVLTRIADRALVVRRRRTKPYRPCFFDPRHGEGLGTRTVPVGDRDLTVPACGACGRTEGAPASMRVAGGLLGRERPWYEHDTVWARTGYGAFVEDLWQHVAAEHRSRR